MWIQRKKAFKSIFGLFYQLQYKNRNFTEVQLCYFGKKCSKSYENQVWWSISNSLPPLFTALATHESDLYWLFNFSHWSALLPLKFLGKKNLTKSLAPTPILWCGAQLKILNCDQCDRYSYLWLKANGDWLCFTEKNSMTPDYFLVLYLFFL